MLLFGSCSSTIPVIIYDEIQIEEGQIALKEMMRETSSNSIEKIQSSLPAISYTTLFTQTQKIQFEQEKNLPGVQKRIDVFIQQLKEELDTILNTLLIEKDLWIEELEVESPYTYIIGRKDSITTLFKDELSLSLETYLQEELNSKKQLITTYNKFLTIINAYIITENELKTDDKKEVLGNWDNTALVSFIVSELIKEMAIQETIIRYLAPTYDSPYIRLFSK